MFVLGITGKQGTFWSGDDRLRDQRSREGQSKARASETTQECRFLRLHARRFAKVGRRHGHVHSSDDGERWRRCLSGPSWHQVAGGADRATSQLRMSWRCMPRRRVWHTHQLAQHCWSCDARRGVLSGSCLRSCPSVFRPVVSGVISRSGSLGTLICLNLTRAGLGQSAFIGIGGRPDARLSATRDALEALAKDDRHRRCHGGRRRDRWCDGRRRSQLRKKMTKPVVAFIAGAAAPAGKKMGHAGANRHWKCAAAMLQATSIRGGGRHCRRYAIANRCRRIRGPQG